MTQELNIAENNILIDVFMGESSDIEEVTTESVYAKELKYHCSWDALMPVVEKIESLGGDVAIYFNTTLINHTYLDKEIHKGGIPQYNKLKACYKAVVQFIKWYNQNTKQLSGNPKA